MADLSTDYECLRHGVGAIWLERDVVRVAGPDAAGFLQGQCSQDLAPLVVGQSAWSLILQPQGKVEALVRVLRVADDAFVLDVDTGFGEVVRMRLNRFKLRVKADLEPLDWRCLALRGPKTVDTPPDRKPDRQAGDGVWVVDASWPGLDGFDLIGPCPSLAAGVPVVGRAAYEAARIEAGIPRMGAELTERTIPAEAGIVERTVSFTKGCFTGQELVARIDSRGGHVPRRLRGVVLDEEVPVGATLRLEGKQIGSLTSVAARPGGAVALAYVGRDLQPPAEVEVSWDAGDSKARVEALPLVR